MLGLFWIVQDMTGHLQGMFVNFCSCFYNSYFNYFADFATHPQVILITVHLKEEVCKYGVFFLYSHTFNLFDVLFTILAVYKSLEAA